MKRHAVPALLFQLCMVGWRPKDHHGCIYDSYLHVRYQKNGGWLVFTKWLQRSGILQLAKKKRLNHELWQVIQVNKNLTFKNSYDIGLSVCICLKPNSLKKYLRFGVFGAPYKILFKTPKCRAIFFLKLRALPNICRVEDFVSTPSVKSIKREVPIQAAVASPSWKITLVSIPLYSWHIAAHFPSVLSKRRLRYGHQTLGIQPARHFSIFSNGASNMGGDGWIASTSIDFLTSRSTHDMNSCFSIVNVNVYYKWILWVTSGKQHPSVSFVISYIPKVVSHQLFSQIAPSTLPTSPHLKEALRIIRQLLWPAGAAESYHPCYPQTTERK